MSANLTFLLEFRDTVSSGLKRRETFQCVISVQFKPYTAAITPTWLHSLGAELVCLQSRSFTYREHLVHHWTKNISKTTTNISAARKIYQEIMGPNSNTKTTETHNLDAQTSSNCFEKKRRCYSNMSLSQRFWDLFQASSLKLAHFVHTILNVLV